MSWADFHKASEAAAIEAEQAFRDGNISQATLLYAKAAEHEQQALAAVDATKARTRGITAVSAVSLWYKAIAYDRAEQLAYSMLADPSIPGFARTDLRNLVQAIWTEGSKLAANVSFLPGQVFVSVKGGDVITGGARFGRREGADDSGHVLSNDRIHKGHATSSSRSAHSRHSGILPSLAFSSRTRQLSILCGDSGAQAA